MPSLSSPTVSIGGFSFVAIYVCTQALVDCLDDGDRTDSCARNSR